MPIERRKPLDEGSDTATDLLERELEGGLKIEESARPQADEDSVRRDLGGLLVTEEHVTTRKRDVKD